MFLKNVVVAVTLPGSDGMFEINSTSGCISLTTDPGQLRSELYEVRVKVGATSTPLHGSEPPAMLPLPDTHSLLLVILYCL